MSTGEHDPDSPVSTVDENEGPRPEPEAEPGPAVEAEAEAPKPKLDLEVQISDVGPCKKHLTITIARTEVDRQFNDSLGTMKRDAIVPGFRPGHAPRTLVEKRFRKQVGEQVKSTLLVAALEQLDADYKLKPISEPKLDVAAITIPDQGPFQFEMEVEVQPTFALPAYKALTIERPVKTIGEADVDAQMQLFLERHAQMVPKLEGGAAIGDFLTVDIRFHRDGRTTNEVKETQIRLQPELRFQDGSAPDIGAVLEGIKPGEEREIQALIGSSSVDPSLRGQTIQATIKVHDLKQYRLPQVDAAFLSSLGLDSQESLREGLRAALERRLKSQQREAMRRGIMDKLIAETAFELPADLVTRQESSTVRRLIMELKQQGLSENEIRAREASIRANAAEATHRSLKEFFILGQIAEAEGIKVEDKDITLEIEEMAAQSEESPRRVRSRIEKEGLADALGAQILERKTLDRILEYVKSKEVPLIDQDVAVETLDQSATTAPPPAEPGAEEPDAPAAVAEGANVAEGSAG